MAHSPILARARRRLTRLARRYARGDQGSTAVEFALVAVPFLMLIFAVIELGLVFLVSVSLESAIIDTGRTIRTGELQTANGTAATFKDAVCAKMSWLGSKCAAALSIDVNTYTDYAATTTTTASTTVPTTMNFNPGSSGSIVLIRAYYTWPLITPMLNTGLQSSNGKRIIYAATAFTNEPYAQ